ncbi:MFS transporter [Lysinimonas soli]|uniref:MFS transporter n=1 Tax=Lysinimonas soli TaxID=1074233 RepID=A0ABW0NL75_9MICO
MTDIEQSYAPMRQVLMKLGILAFGLFIVGTNAFVIAGLLPQIARALRVTPEVVSYSITFYALVVAIVAPTISILLSRVSRTILMASGLGLIAVGTALAAASTGIEAFTIGRMIAGIGGAALVPTATAAATALVPPARRGTAIAFVSAGFTLSTAIGAPLGTAIGASGGWELPLWALAGLSALLVPAVLLGVRDIPLSVPASLGRRLASLRDGRLTLTLFAGLFIFAAFNSVYIFSSSVTGTATDGDGTLLAALLFGYGLAGIVGNVFAGPLTDRLGARVFGTIALAVQVALLALLPLLDGSFLWTMVLFVVWGLTAFASAVPLQHRLVDIDPAKAGIALSWWASATYLGVAVAPLLGASALAIGVPFVPVIGAVLAVVSLGLFQFGYRARRASRPESAPAAVDGAVTLEA